MGDTLNRRKRDAWEGFLHATEGFVPVNVNPDSVSAAVDAADAAVDRKGAEDVLEDFLRGESNDETYVEMLNRAIDVALGRRQ